MQTGIGRRCVDVDDVLSAELLESGSLHIRVEATRIGSGRNAVVIGCRSSTHHDCSIATEKVEHAGVNERDDIVGAGSQSATKPVPLHLVPG